MPKKPTPLKPSQVFAARMRYLRERRRWTQQDLADRLAEMGDPTDRVTVARTETLARGLSLDDAVLYAAALGGSLTHMVATPPPPISGDTPIAIAPKMVVHPAQVRRWVRGVDPLQPEDTRTFFEEVSEDEWVARQDYHLQWILARVQDLVDAVGDEDGDEVVKVIDDINAGLERQKADRARKGTQKRSKS